MKRFFLALLSFTTLAAAAQTADEVIQKYSAAMGGLDAFNKVTTVKMTGTVVAQGNEFPLTTQMVNNKAVRTDVDVQGQQIVNVYNNGTGWKINPYAGAESATEITGQELIDAKAQASIANHLMDYKNRGHKVEFAGQEDVEGVKCFKIKLTNKDDNKVNTYYISSSNYMLVKSVGLRDMQGQQMEVETFYSDFKDINGLKFAMTRSQKMQGNVFQEIKLEKVELNVPVDESIFKM
jgi:hypothetical protein